MVELLQSILTLTKEFGPGMVSSVGCLVLVWYMRTHIKDIGKQHNERFDKLHEMHRDERDKRNASTGATLEKLGVIVQNNNVITAGIKAYLEAKS